MNTVSLILLIIFGIIAVFLTIIVALQGDEDSGIGGIFGGNGGSLFGASTSKVIIKITAFLAALFLVLALTIAIVNKSGSNDSLLTATEGTVEEAAPWYSNTSSAGASEAATDSAESTVAPSQESASEAN